MSRGFTVQRGATPANEASVPAREKVVQGRMAYEDGLDKRELVKGRDAIESLLQRSIPAMKESGGGFYLVS